MAQICVGIDWVKPFGGKLGRWLGAVLIGLALAACAPLQQQALRPVSIPVPGFDGNVFTSFDGAKLGLTTWRPLAPCEAELAEAASQGREIICLPPGEVRAEYRERNTVIIAIHGMNDYAGAFNSAGAWWASQGGIVYAYDQRGHGRSPQPGIWPQPDVMRKDLNTAVDVARRRHPGARIVVVGESMGAAVAMTAFGSDDPPKADALVLSGPGLRGWGTLPVLYRVSLWTSAHVRPAWIVVPPKGVRITTTDNREKQIEMWKDPYVLKTNRIDSVYGVVSIMEEADKAASRLAPDVPTLLLYGGKDEMIPAPGVERTAKKLPKHVHTAYYLGGYHMLLNDLAAETVWRDILAFARNPDAKLPSGAPPLPWAPKIRPAATADAARPKG